MRESLEVISAAHLRGFFVPISRGEGAWPEGRGVIHHALCIGGRGVATPLPLVRPAAN
jgi:hypothetical protein